LQFYHLQTYKKYQTVYFNQDFFQSTVLIYTLFSLIISTQKGIKPRKVLISSIAMLLHQKSSTYTEKLNPSLHHRTILHTFSNFV